MGSFQRGKCFTGPSTWDSVLKGSGRFGGSYSSISWSMTEISLVILKKYRERRLLVRGRVVSDSGKMNAACNTSLHRGLAAWENISTALLPPGHTHTQPLLRLEPPNKVIPWQKVTCHRRQEAIPSSLVAPKAEEILL